MRVPFSIRIDSEVLEEIKKIAIAENRSEASVGEDCILGYLPILKRATEARAAVLKDSPLKYAVPGQGQPPRRGRVVSKKSSN